MDMERQKKTQQWIFFLSVHRERAEFIIYLKNYVTVKIKMFHYPGCIYGCRVLHNGTIFLCLFPYSCWWYNVLMNRRRWRRVLRGTSKKFLKRFLNSRNFSIKNLKDFEYFKEIFITNHQNKNISNRPNQPSKTTVYSIMNTKM